jgi:hypothetical protein
LKLLLDSCVWGGAAAELRSNGRGLLRIAGFAARQQSRVIQHVLSTYGIELQSGAVVTALPGRVRIRPPEPNDRG